LKTAWSVHIANVGALVVVEAGHVPVDIVPIEQVRIRVAWTWTGYTGAQRVSGRC
jgi:hypothetical protein